MPVEGILDHPDFMAMPAAGAGILLRLLLHFWVTECRPLPVADHELRSIARAHAPTWRHWKPQVLRVFEAVRPSLESYYSQRLNKQTALSRLAQREQSRRRLKALQERHTTPDPVPVYAMGLVPKRAAQTPSRPGPPEKRSRPTALLDRNIVR
jgi:hypothetical protein